jgi:hypothetical protein
MKNVLFTIPNMQKIEQNDVQHKKKRIKRCSQYLNHDLIRVGPVFAGENQNESKWGGQYDMIYADFTNQNDMCIFLQLDENFDLETINTVVLQIESKIRTGKKIFRQILHDMILYVFLNSMYHNQIKIQQIQKSKKKLNIGLFPDIYIYLIRCMAYNSKSTDEMVNFIRSSIPFFSNPRRVHKKKYWGDNNADSLKILLRCCLASLLSIYSDVSCKDVDFWVRASIYNIFHNLLISTHKQRATFFADNKPLLRTCIAEYVMYYIKFISPLPYTLHTQNIDFETMFTNSFNIGQQLRVDINMEYSKIKQKQTYIVTKKQCMDILSKMNTKCQIMYERNMRCNKISISKLYHIDSISSMTKSRRLIRMQTIKVFKECMHIIKTTPYIKDFMLFESYCIRIGLNSEYINIIWDTLNNVKIHEISGDLIHKQLISLNSEFGINTRQMTMKRKLLLCIVCNQHNMSSMFRYDARSMKFLCNKCDIYDSVYEIDMLGRVIVINNIPVYLSPYSNNIVLWNGYNTNLIPEIRWSLLNSLNAVNLLVNNMHSFSCIFLNNSHNTVNTKLTNIIDRNFIVSRMNGNRALLPLVSISRTQIKCSFCRSNSIYEFYNIIDIYNKEVVSVPVCAKHNVPKYIIETQYMNITTLTNIITGRKKINV